MPTVFLTLEILKPPMLAAQRLEQISDRELIERQAGDGLADERRVIKRMRGVAAARAGIKRKLRESRVARVPGRFPRCD